MHVAIVGCGFIASQYAQAIHASPQLDLVATMDRIPEHAQRLAQQHGCTPYQHLPDLLAQSEAELIVNLTTPLAHADVTRTWVMYSTAADNSLGPKTRYNVPRTPPSAGALSWYRRSFSITSDL